MRNPGKRTLTDLVSRERADKFISPYKTEKDYWGAIQDVGTAGDNFDATLTYWGYSGSFMDKVDAWTGDLIGTHKGIRERLIDICDNFNGITFAKNFRTFGNGTTGTANFSVGLPTGAITADRSATNPATYVDSNGVIQLVTTANIPRYVGGLYDATGFHSAEGMLVEGARTNLLVRTDGTASGSGLWTGWSENGNKTGTSIKSQVLCPTLTSIPSAAAQRVQYTGVAGDAPDKTIQLDSTATAVGSVVNTNVVTISAYIRSQTGNTGVVINYKIASRDVDDTLITVYSGSNITASLSTTFRKFSFTTTITDATSSRVRGRLVADGVGDGDTVDIEVYGMQVEVAPYPSSFIPTTTAALTRNAETPYWLIAGNRTAAQESIFIKFMPLGGSFANDGVNRYILDNDGDRRPVFKSANFSTTIFRPNVTDSTNCQGNSTTIPQVNTSYIVTSTMQHSNPYASIYINGTLEGTPEAVDDFTNPDFGTYFYIGSYYTGSSQIGGLIQEICIYNRLLSSSEVSAINVFF